MTAHRESNKKIAKNSLLLYCRMTFVMILGIYSSRFLINGLGIENYGIYILIGGVVSFFAVFNAAMMSATQRFLNYGIGRNDAEHVTKVFHTSFVIHLRIALFIFIIVEICGLWLLYNKLIIPENKMFSAFVVFQATTISLIVNIISLPFNALLISHENISIFALLQTIQSVINFCIAVAINYCEGNVLVQYAIAVAILQISIGGAYVAYCRRHYVESTGKFKKDSQLFKEMTRFAGWCMVGCTSGILSTQGIGILLGMFFMPFVNAARGIALTVQSAVNQIWSNVQTAIMPQVIQSYSCGDFTYFYKLINSSSKFFALLLLLVVIPIDIKTEYIINLWLGEVPEYSVVFVRLLTLASLIEAISAPLMRASDACGDIKKYHLVVGGILMLIFPIAYIALKLGGHPPSVFIIYVIIAFFALIARLIILREKISLSTTGFIVKVLIPVFLVTLISGIISLFFSSYFPDTFIGLVLFCFASLGINLLVILAIGLSSHERQLIYFKIKSLRKPVTKP